MATTDEFAAASIRGARRLASAPTARAAYFDAATGKIVVELTNGFEVRFVPAATQGLAAATPEELEQIEISPTGLGIHFPAIDADLYVPALLTGALGSRAWAASMGRAGGLATTEAKATAARANGRLGGRPRKQAA